MRRALIAQLDRVQVSEACGVGSSPAERTIIIYKINTLSIFWRDLYFLKKKTAIFAVTAYYFLYQIPIKNFKNYEVDLMDK